MRWLFHRPSPPHIPPAPEAETDPDATRRMGDLVKARTRRGRRVTRETQTAIAQNHFIANFKEAFKA